MIISANYDYFVISAMPFSKPEGKAVRGHSKKLAILSNYWRFLVRVQSIDGHILFEMLLLFLPGILGGVVCPAVLGLGSCSSHAQAVLPMYHQCTHARVPWELRLLRERKSSIMRPTTQ
jgi:hypothetical protein